MLVLLQSHASYAHDQQIADHLVYVHVVVALVNAVSYYGCPHRLAYCEPVNKFVINDKPLDIMEQGDSDSMIRYKKIR